MRIIAGKWRGLPLLSPPGPQTRPILDRVKEAVFDVLGSRLALPGQLPPCSVLDLFAGTGSLGLEALSRGASYCTFVESHRQTANELRANITKVQAGGYVDLRVEDVWKLDFVTLNPPASYELVFVDPPYRDARSLEPDSPVHQLLTSLCASPRIHRDGLIILRHPEETTCEDRTFPVLHLTDQRSYGEMSISFLGMETHSV